MSYTYKQTDIQNIRANSNTITTQAKSNKSHLALIYFDYTD